MMKQPYSVSRMDLYVSRGIFFGCALFLASEVRADGYAECNQILTQDIFNRVIKSEYSSAASQAEAKAAFYQQSDTEAFSAYKNARKEAQKNGTSINTEFHYGVIGGELGVNLNSEKELSSEEFSQKFNKAKQTYQSSTSSKSSSSQSLINNYASYVRDPSTVTAWKDCVTKTKDTNLYAFASRDQAGQTFINVIWVPGVLAGSLPSIPISFVTDGDADGVKVHANAEEQIAMGSGRNFAVSCGKKCDNGFQVTVNGTLKNAAGNPTNSFTSTVDIPPLKLPAPPSPPECSWEGDWDTEWDYGGEKKGSSIITFTRNGEEMYGKYQYGHIVLKGHGDVLVGRWYNTAGTSGHTCTDGAVKYTKHGCTFEGAWAYCGDAPHFVWTGTKIQ